MSTVIPLSRIPYARFLGVRLEEGATGLVCVLPFRDDLVGNASLAAREFQRIG